MDEVHDHSHPQSSMYIDWTERPLGTFAVCIVSCLSCRAYRKIRVYTEEVCLMFQPTIPCAWFRGAAVRAVYSYIGTNIVVLLDGPTC